MVFRAAGGLDSLAVAGAGFVNVLGDGGAADEGDRLHQRMRAECVDAFLIAVDDIDAARNDLVARGVDVSEVFHYAGGPFNNSVQPPRISGRDPEGRSYYSFASFEDPDGNGWLFQEVPTRLPGREWKLTRAAAADVATLAELLRETAEHHDHYEKTHAEHHWWDWYAAYLSARQNGSSPGEAAAAAGRHMEEALHVLPR